MKTNNFFLIHMFLVRKGYYKAANWLLREVIGGRRPRIISHSLSNDAAWQISHITGGNGYNFKLTY
jgi:hypothetical protein